MYRLPRLSRVVKSVDKMRNVAQAGTKTISPVIHVLQKALIMAV